MKTDEQLLVECSTVLIFGNKSTFKNKAGPNNQKFQCSGATCVYYWNSTPQVKAQTDNTPTDYKPVFQSYSCGEPSLPCQKMQKRLSDVSTFRGWHTTHIEADNHDLWFFFSFFDVCFMLHGATWHVFGKCFCFCPSISLCIETLKGRTMSSTGNCCDAWLCATADKLSENSEKGPFLSPRAQWVIFKLLVLCGQQSITQIYLVYCHIREKSIKPLHL